MTARLAALERTSNRLADILDVNTTIFRDSFSALEAQTHVTQRIVGDVMCGGELKVRVIDGSDRYQVDFAAYFFEYMFCTVFGQWVRDFCNLDAPTTDPAPPPEESENVVVFGG